MHLVKKNCFSGILRSTRRTQRFLSSSWCGIVIEKFTGNKHAVESKVIAYNIVK